MLLFPVCSIALILFLLPGCKTAEKPKAAPPVTEVAVLTVAPTDIPEEVSFVAQLQSSHKVDIIARVNGFLDRIAYREGKMVREGDILFEIDRKPFLAQRDAARADLERRKAELWTAKANLDRIRPLAELNAASKSDLDNATGQFMTAEAALAQSEAQLSKAELDLSYTTIRSPITGVAGQAQVREGTYLAAGGSNSLLTSVSILDPLWVEFSVSQNQFTKSQEEVAGGLIVPPANSQFAIEIELADGNRYPHTGHFTFVDQGFNPQTGTLLVRVELPNPEGILHPGMFVKAWVTGAIRRGAILVPQKAVQQTANGHVVYLANDKGQAEVRPVIVGGWSGQNWVIKQGLHPGERVIVAGFQRLAPGMPVRVVDDAAKPPAQPAGDR
jgi:membrane fusion protein (multidrug efflux system)